MLKEDFIKGVIEGLPVSYDVSYILKTKKKCNLCTKGFTKKQINESKVLYLEFYDFVHKKCVSENNIEYKHIRKKDLYSPAQLIKKKKKKKKQ